MSITCVPPSLRQRCKIDRALLFLGIFVAGKKGHVRILSAMSHRNSGVGWTRDRRRNSRHNLERNSAAASACASSPPLPNTNGSPPFKPDDLVSRLRFFDQQRVDLILRQRMRARLFPGVNNLCVLGRPPQHFWIAR